MIVGRDRSPIVIVDDVFANAEAIAVFGRREAVFTPPATAYPGLNAPVGEDAMAPWLKAVQTPARRHVRGVVCTAGLRRLFRPGDAETR